VLAHKGAPRRGIRISAARADADRDFVVLRYGLRAPTGKSTPFISDRSHCTGTDELGVGTALGKRGLIVPVINRVRGEPVG